MLPACTQISHDRRGLTQYAEHTRISVETTRPTSSGKYLDSYTKRTHSNSPVQTTLQIHGTAMGTKMAVAIANIFMSAVETETISLSNTKPPLVERYVDHIFSR